MEKEQLQELIENNKEDIFSEIKDEISDDTVTDIEWDGYNLWITQLGRGCYISMKELSDKYMDNLSIRLANIMGASFNRMHPILEANTESLRISIWHESRCGRKSMAIRKIPRKLRFGHGDLVKSDYAPESIITLLENLLMCDKEAIEVQKILPFLSDTWPLCRIGRAVIRASPPCQQKNNKSQCPVCGSCSRHSCTHAQQFSLQTPAAE